MPANKLVDRIRLAFQQGKPIDNALKEAAKSAKTEHEARERARRRLVTLRKKSRIGEVIKPSGERWNAERDRS